MRSRLRIRSLALATVLGLAPAACNDTTSPRAAVAGEYWAGRPTPSSAVVGTFTTTENGVTTDMLAGGSHIRLVLNESGATSGIIVVPDLAQDDLAGSWALDGDVVRLTLSADNFMRDIDFRAREGRLEGEGTFAGVTVHVVLQRVP